MYIIIKTSSSSKKVCKKIANLILSDNLSPCINISKSNSLYKWKKEIQSDKEYILNIKTIKKYKDKICTIIKENHNYDIPEIISYDFTILHKEYSEWFNENI